MGKGINWESEVIISDNPTKEQLTILSVHNKETGITKEHIIDQRFSKAVAELHWSENYKGYAKTSIPINHELLRQYPTMPRTVCLHRFIWLMAGHNIPSSYVIDHINMNVRDNRLSNLRAVTWSQNLAHNKDRYEKPNHDLQFSNNYWRVKVRIDNAIPFEPAFRTRDEAIVCRDLYLSLRDKYFAGLISKPTKEQLKNIATAVKVVRPVYV